MGTYKDHNYYNVAFAERKHYHTHWRESYYVPMWEVIIGILDIIKPGRILDVGCGTGQFAAMLEDYGYTDYAGFDFSTVAIELARKASKQKFYVGDAREVQCYDYDTAICLETLEHADDLKILQNIRHGATVIFSVPDFDDQAHLRHFSSIQQVRDRYSPLLEFKLLIKFDRFFIGRAIKK